MNLHSCKSIENDYVSISIVWPVLYICCISPFGISKLLLTVEGWMMNKGIYYECHSSAWQYINLVQMTVIILILYGYVYNQFKRVDEIFNVFNKSHKCTYRYYLWIELKYLYGNIKIEEMKKMHFHETTVFIKSLINGHIITSKSR